MNAYGRALVSSLIDAGYPAPLTADAAGRYSIAWGQSEDAPQIHAADSGVVSVWMTGSLVAEFVLGDGFQSASDWVALLHPLIAEPVTVTTAVAVAPPTLLTTRVAEIAWLDHDAQSGVTYAVYTDGARVRVPDGPLSDVVDSLIGTARGNQLGFTPDSLIAVRSADRGTVMVSRHRSVAGVVLIDGQPRPALTFRDTRGFLDRAAQSDRAESALNVTSPHIELDYHVPCASAADAAGASESLLREAKRQQGASGTPDGVQVW